MKKIMFCPILYLMFPVFISSLTQAQTSHLIIANIAAPSLENNKLGIPNIQSVAIYLPPSYDSSSLRYPVAYFLGGFGDVIQDWTNGTYQYFRIRNVMDNLITNRTLHEFIVVIASGRNFMGGSFYVNSSVSGNWEDFILKDVVGYIDENYRTIKNPASRGISGHSMGGFGALNLAMHHPEIFGLVCGLSPGLFDTTGLVSCQLFKSMSFITQIMQKDQEYTSMSFQAALTAFQTYIQTRNNAGDWDTPFAYAYSTAFSPNPDIQIPCINYPYSPSGDTLIVDSSLLQIMKMVLEGLRRRLLHIKIIYWRFGA